MKKLLDRFYSLTRARQIALTVCLIHFFMVIGLSIHHLASGRLKPPRPMVIRTIVPQIAAKAPVSTKITPSAKKVASPKPQTVAPTPKKPAPNKKPIPQKVQKKSAPIQKNLPVETAEFQLEQPKRNELQIPSLIESKARSSAVEEAASDLSDPTYGELLIAFLQNALELPEFGEVRAKIEIDGFGNIVDCQILEAKSQKNSQFLKNRLPELTVPCLNDSQSVTITFRNVEIH